jgi:hypothetical protein
MSCLCSCVRPPIILINPILFYQKTSNKPQAQLLFTPTPSRRSHFHRPLSAIHLPATGDSLFPMARRGSSTVIYIIITNKMETLHTISPEKNKSHFQFRSILIVAGIVIAIICSLVSLKEIHAAENTEASVPRSIETPSFVNAELVMNTASAIVSFGDRISQ